MTPHQFYLSIVTARTTYLRRARNYRKRKHTTRFHDNGIASQAKAEAYEAAAKLLDERIEALKGLCKSVGLTVKEALEAA